MESRLLKKLDEAERKAIDALARYKFMNFGYWAAIWVHLNRISGARRPSPFKKFVLLARQEEIQKSTKPGQFSIICPLDFLEQGEHFMSGDQVYTLTQNYHGERKVVYGLAVQAEGIPPKKILQIIDPKFLYSQEGQP